MDEMRRMQGALYFMDGTGSVFSGSGAFYRLASHNLTHTTMYNFTINGQAHKQDVVSFDSGRVVLTSAVSRPRSLGALACAWMGKPAL